MIAGIKIIIFVAEKNSSINFLLVAG